jgi:[acyl-carrier-protein] S-malonyltransferase
MSKTALLFAGQGAQVVGMGKDLAEHSPGARAWFDRANAVLGYDLASICFSGPEAELTKTEHAQPGIFLVSWAAFELLKERVPALSFQATAGLSLGEFTALTAAGAVSFEAGLKVVRQRGRFMQEACEATRGGMAAISGATDKIAPACELAKAKGAKRALPLTVAGAYHSPLMASAQPKLEAELARVSLVLPAVPVIANVTAQPHDGRDAIRARLVAQVTSSVRWEESMRYLIAQGFTRFIELGPGRALSGFMKRIDKTVQILNVEDLATLEATAKALTS